MRFVPLVFAAVALGCGGTTSDPSDTVAGSDGASVDVAVAVDVVADVEPEADAGLVTDILEEDVSMDIGSPSDVNPTVPTEDVPMVADGGSEGLPPGLHGQAPPDALPLPSFVATSHDGTSRGPDDLVV